MFELYFAMSNNKIDNNIFTIEDKTKLNLERGKLLSSYHYFSIKNMRPYFDTFPNEKIFVDSGAFSAYNSNVGISIDDYIRFIQDTNCEMYCSLDCIGNAEQSLQNYLTMNELKDKIILPVFHLQDRVEYLYKYLNLDCNYIALGGMVGTHKNVLDSWLKKVWKIILDEKPNLKVHAFGVTVPEILEKFPWKSADSSSWLACIKYNRYMDYNSYNNTFDTYNTNRLFVDSEFDHKLGDPINGKKRWFVLQKQVNQYLLLKDTINDLDRNKDYSYLTDQLTLF